MDSCIPVHLGEYVFGALANDLRASQQHRVLLVADENTYPACVQQVNEALIAAGLVVTWVVLSGQPRVAANESSIAEVLRALNGRALALVAVGSGTVTDIFMLAKLKCTRLSNLPCTSETG